MSDPYYLQSTRLARVSTVNTQSTTHVRTKVLRYCNNTDPNNKGILCLL